MSTYNFPDACWDMRERVAFTVDTLSGESTYDALVMSFRYSRELDVETLPIVVETESGADGSYRCDTLRIPFLSQGERTARNGRLGVFESADTLPELLNPSPGMEITVYPVGDRPQIHGLYSITLTLEKR